MQYRRIGYTFFFWMLYAIQAAVLIWNSEADTLSQLPMRMSEIESPAINGSQLEIPIKKILLSENPNPIFKPSQPNGACDNVWSVRLSSSQIGNPFTIS